MARVVVRMARVVVRMARVVARMARVVAQEPRVVVQEPRVVAREPRVVARKSRQAYRRFIMKHWIPQAILEFVAFCKKWKTVLETAAYVTAFGWVQEAVTACLAAIDAFVTAYDAWTADDSSLKRAQRDDARNAAEQAIEHFAAHSVRYNEKMTETQRYEILGVRTWHPGHPIDVPPTVPELSIRLGHICQLIVEYRDLGALRNGKPDNVHGIEIRWAFLDHPPVDIEAELFNSAFDTRHPFRITFKEADRGKTVYFAARWEIMREGKKGDFGPIVSAVVP
jgi:hypothetical protein